MVERGKPSTEDLNNLAAEVVTKPNCMRQFKVWNASIQNIADCVRIKAALKNPEPVPESVKEKLLAELKLMRERRGTI